MPSKFMKTKLFLAWALISGFLMAGCSSSPSAGDAEQVLRQQIDSESNGQIKLVSFRKTDGQKQVVNGVQLYELDYEAEIEFETDGTWLSDIGGGQGISFKLLTGADRPTTNLGQFGEMPYSPKDVHRGSRAKISGVMEGEKKESGWKLEVGSKYSILGLTTPNNPPPTTASPSKPSENAPAANSIFANMSPDQIVAKVKDDLRQIDGAKNMYALEQGKSNGDPCTEKDITPYIVKDILIHPPGGHFIINPVGTPPESSTYGKFGSF
jgi:hypothetical protein